MVCSTKKRREDKLNHLHNNIIKWQLAIMPKYIHSILKISTRQFSKLCLGIGAASIIQGSYFLTRYRFNHGDAPHPISPSRGIVSLDELNVVDAKSCFTEGDTGHSSITPIKILVVGDSLACGCGISKSSTPILPESIARHMARQLGRPVHWSCVGAPGASTKGILNILQKWFAPRGVSSGANSDYDIVVVLAGMNDMKDIFLPFLAYEHVDSSFGDGLKKIFGVLKQKLRPQISPALINYNLQNEDEKPSIQRHFLMVLPALPIHAVPLFNYPPIGVFLTFIISYMESAKEKLSREFPNNVLYVKAPSQTLIEKFESGTSKFCLDLKCEHAMASFNDTKCDAKKKIEKLMHDHTSYFERDAESEAEIECDQAWYLNLRPGIPEVGASLISYDSIHPNEKGYNFWGRYIAAAVIDEWKRDKPKTIK